MLMPPARVTLTSRLGRLWSGLIDAVLDQRLFVDFNAPSPGASGTRAWPPMTSNPLFSRPMLLQLRDR